MPLVKGDHAQHSRISELSPDPASIRTWPAGAQAGFHLIQGDWEQAHGIAQDLHTPEGSYWHAILHRQEPDEWNSNYWFRQAGRHPIFPALNEKVAALIQEYSSTGFTVQDKWDPVRFTRFCETARARPGSEDEELAIQIQHAEWELLFHYCCEEATK